MRRLIEHFANLLKVTYAQRLADVGLTVGPNQTQDCNDLKASMSFDDDNVEEMQEVGMAMLADIQDFLQVCQKITNFFYRRCFTLENTVF